MVPQQQRRRRRRAVLSKNAERRVVVVRGAGGFGFTIAGQRPCVVSAVATGGPAERAGLRTGDALLAVDGVNVSRSPHASVARTIAGADGPIALTVAPRESPPTDTEDTEPEERARTRRRYPPPRRRPQPAVLHHPGCHAAPTTSGISEILQNISRAQLAPSQAARLECRAVVGYLGTIETPQATANSAPENVRNAVRKLRQERRAATPVLLSVLPSSLLLRRPSGQVLAQYQRERIVYAGCGSEADRRFFGLVTAAEVSDSEAEVFSHSCHVFVVDPRMTEHDAHVSRAREFQINCTRDPVAERCLEFPPSAEYVVGVIRGMYSLPPDDCASPVLQQISKLAVKSESPAPSNFSRSNRPAFRPVRERRPCRHEEIRMEPEFVANSPQPSNHSEITTTSSNSDSGIGFHNDCRNIADRILVVDFANQQPVPNRYHQEISRPLGLVGCSSFDADGSFLSNTTPVVDGFGGQGRPLNLDDVILNANDLARHNPRSEDDNYNYNNIYGNMPSGSRGFNGAVYDQVYTENEGHYEFIPSNLEMDEVDRVGETFNSVEIYEERARHPDYHSNESVENVTVISGRSKISMDTVSVYSSRSHEEARPSRRKHLQASLDDMLVLGLRDQAQGSDKDEGKFLHPGAVKCKVRKSIKPLNLLSKTKNMLTGKSDKRDEDCRRRSLSASAGDESHVEDALPAAASEPDLRDSQSEQSSPFRRWTTGSGAGSSYRHHEHRNIYNKQMSEGGSPGGGKSGGGVARWSLGLEHLLADSAGAAAFAHFLDKEFAAENIRFWWSCEQYRTCSENESESVEVRASLANAIWQRHLGDKAPEPVNIDASAKRATALRLDQRPPPADLFIQAQKQIFNVMKFDSYPRFLRSGVHAECARADLRGLPCPYLPPAETNNKVKKSSSNASDRRRSGGGSLLGWRLRSASRDRVEEDTPPTTDVVAASQTLSGGCSLCRVVLPDGATSVVGVDEGVTVRRLVDRLLQRRNLLCTTYDVLLDDQGESRVIDAESPSTILSGKCAIVERRCVVRVRIGPRAVLVRCRPARRLRHVLRPLLQRYPPDGNVRNVPTDAQALHPDTSLQELDGARLQIVEFGEGEWRAVRIHQRGEREDDADSIPDVTLRPHDEDTLSIDRTSGSSGGFSEASRNGSDGPNPQSSLSQGPVPANRVRATLRPGPPLHHHPPHFLENLRETQRQRLQPRTPPPLPPKPTQRTAPTVV